MIEGLNMKKARNKKRSNLAKDIAIAVIATSICNILLQLFGNIPQVGKTILATIQNFVFSSAARASSNTIIIMMFEMLLGFVLSFSVSHLANSIIYCKKDKRIQKYEQTIKEIELNIKNNPQNIEAYKLRLQSASNELESFSKEIKNDGNKRRKTNVILTFLAVFISPN